MNVYVNGRAVRVEERTTVADALAQAAPAAPHRRGVAVAVDAEVVPRSQWTTRRLRDGARVEVVSAVQGG